MNFVVFVPFVTICIKYVFTKLNNCSTSKQSSRFGTARHGTAYYHTKVSGTLNYLSRKVTEYIASMQSLSTCRVNCKYKLISHVGPLYILSQIIMKCYLEPRAVVACHSTAYDDQGLSMHRWQYIIQGQLSVPVSIILECCQLEPRDGVGCHDTARLRM